MSTIAIARFKTQRVATATSIASKPPGNKDVRALLLLLPRCTAHSGSVETAR